MVWRKSPYPGVGRAVAGRILSAYARHHFANRGIHTWQWAQCIQNTPKKPKGTLLLWNRDSSKKCLIFGWTPQNAKVVVSVPRCVQRRQSFSDLSELFFAEPSKEDHPSPLTRRSVPTVVSAPSCVRLTHLRSELTENQAFPFRNRTVSLSTI